MFGILVLLLILVVFVIGLRASAACHTGAHKDSNACRMLNKLS